MKHNTITLFIITLCTAFTSKATDTLTVKTPPLEAPSLMTDSAEIDSVAIWNAVLDSLATADQTMKFMMRSPHHDKYSSGIIPKILLQEPDYAKRLVRNTRSNFIIVDKGTMTLYLYDRFGQPIKSYPMACSRNFGAKRRKGDNRTPEGYFTAGTTHDSRSWLYTNDQGYTSPVKGVYGPRFIRVNPASNQVGIHGTNSPNSPGKRVSHGCIRLRNDNILDLVKYVSAGTPIIINPSERDQAVNKKEGRRITRLTIPFGAKPQPRKKKS